MRYVRAERLIHLALEMQAARGGLTIQDIMERWAVSRRTAIRMRDAVIRSFPQADEVPSEDRAKRWRLPSGSARVMTGITADDLAALEVAVDAFDLLNLEVHSENLRLLSAKLRATLPDQDMHRIDPDLEALMEAEGFAHRPGPRPLVPQTTIEVLRKAIKSCKKVSFNYRPLNGRGESRRAVCPIGLLYGHRHYLVTQVSANDRIKFFSLPSISDIVIIDESFERDPSFSLRGFVAQSFGVYEEEPVKVVWRFSVKAAATARQFIFHNSQTFEQEPDGKLIVRFTAGGQLEMAWHLMCWGEDVEVLEPQSLAALLPTKAPCWPALP